MRFPCKATDPAKWHRWFAWHPVRVRDEIVWLETVWRREVCTSWDSYWEYE